MGVHTLIRPSLPYKGGGGGMVEPNIEWLPGVPAAQIASLNLKPSEPWMWNQLISQQKLVRSGRKFNTQQICCHPNTPNQGQVSQSCYYVTIWNHKSDIVDVEFEWIWDV